MNSSKSSLMGAYGSWIEERVSACGSAYSFLDDRWSDVSAWSGEAKKLFAAYPCAGYRVARRRSHGQEDS